VGWDLAHAAGNIPLSLHEWGVDFAAWCSYKYLNSGPGALAGAFVHRTSPERRLSEAVRGLVEHRSATRFKMHRWPHRCRRRTRGQVSNPPIFSMGPRADIAGDLRPDRHAGPAERSIRLTGYLESLLDGLDVVTPKNRGCQLSVRIAGGANELSRRLRFDHGVIADAREPDIMRLAPVPLYSSYHDCWRAAQALKDCV
jgi:kynureninase